MREEENLYKAIKNYIKMKAVILARGFGTHQKEIFPMVLITGKPFLEHQIRFLKENGITEIILAVYHMADKIKSYFGTGHRWGVNLTYSEEEVPLGTAGAIKNAEKYIDDAFLVLNGDSYSQINLKDFIEFHKSKRSDFTISLVKSKDSVPYGNVILKESRIIDFVDRRNISDLINSGVYLFEPRIFDYIEHEKNISLEKNIFPKLAKENLLYGYFYNGYFMNIEKPETYYQFKKDVLGTLLLREYQTVKDAIYKIEKSNIDLVLIVNEQKKLLGVLNNKLIRNHLLRGGNIENNVSEAMVKDPLTVNVNEDKNKIAEILREGTHRLPILDDEGRVVDVEFHVEKIKTEKFPIIRGKAPLRISFAGGGTDLSNFFKEHGGVVINATINKYCHGTIIKRADTKIIIDSDITPGKAVVIDSINHLQYDGKLDLIKAVIKIMQPDFGFELYLHNDIPPGRGLGSSASLSVLIISLLSYLQETHYNEYKTAEIAHKAEIEELKIRGGWQDQYAAVTGGFSFMEFNGEKSIIYPLKLKEDVINELNSHMILCYVGNPHNSDEHQSVLEKSIAENEEEKINQLNKLKEIAIEIKDCLLTNNFEKIGELLHESWMKKRSLSKNVSNPKIDTFYETGIKNGAYGGKLLGSGGGGYILFFCSPQKRNQLKKALERVGGEIMDFNFEFNGTKIWPVKRKF